MLFFSCPIFVIEFTVETCLICDRIFFSVMFAFSVLKFYITSTLFIKKYGSGVVAQWQWLWGTVTICLFMRWYNNTIFSITLTSWYALCAVCIVVPWNREQLSQCRSICKLCTSGFGCPKRVAYTAASDNIVQEILQKCFSILFFRNIFVCWASR